MKKIEPSAQPWQASRGYRKRRLLSPAALAAAGTLVQEVEMEPGATIPPHFHGRSYEFYYVTAGQCVLTIGDEPLKLKEGDMLLTEPGDVHRLYNDGDKPFRLLVFKSNASDDDTYWLEKTAGTGRE